MILRGVVVFLLVETMRRGASNKREFVRSMGVAMCVFRADQPISTYDLVSAEFEVAIAVTRGNPARWRTSAPVTP